MLNIPQVIKNQFKTDGVLKNIRISFPNGEHADICNDQIIKETLKFDESISSRRDIKFGLCESSQLSFDCVGVPNIKGVEIAADIEIDATNITSDIALTDIHEPVIICATPRGETEEKFFVIFDFPILGDGETYLSSDNVDIAWKGYVVDDESNIETNRFEHMPKLSQYRRVTGVDPRGTSEDTYDGLQGGGFLRTYVYSVATGKFYPLLRSYFEFEEDVLPFNIHYDTAFENDEFLEIINHIYLDAESGEYMYPVETQTSPDVPFPFYRVPLGHFIVDECKRDASMERRRVVAYSRMSSLPAYDWWTILNWPVTQGVFEDKTLNFNVMNFILSANRGMFSIPTDAVTVLSGWQQYRLIADGQDAFSIEIQFTSATSGNMHRVTFTVSKYSAYGLEIHELGRDYGKKPWGELSRLLRLDKYDLSTQYESSLAALDTYLVAHNIVEEDVRAQVRKYVEWFSQFNPISMYRCDYFYLDDEIREHNGRPLKVGDMFMAPYYLIVFMSMRVSVASGDDVFIQFLDNISDVTVSEISLGYNNYTIPIKPEVTSHDTLEPITWAYFTFVRSVMSLDVRSLLEGCVELCGCFGRMNRYGCFQFLSIANIELDGLFPNHDILPSGNLYPVSYTSISHDTSDLAIVEDNCMMSLWYEEYFIAFGRISCEYTSSEVLDENDNPLRTTYIEEWNESDEYLTYDISNNEIIKNSVYTSAEIEHLLGPLIQALKNIKFYPHDMKCVGLPYIEAGDWVLASYHDNKILGLILSRTLNGIQAMRDKMKSD